MIGSLGLSNASKFFSKVVMREMGGDGEIYNLCYLPNKLPGGTQM